MLIRVTDPLKIAKFFKDTHVGFEIILTVNIRIKLISGVTTFSLEKIYLLLFLETSVPVNSTAGQTARLQKTVAFLLYGCGV
jgi:hypothetical protein